MSSSSRARPATRTRGWWRDFFHDHPRAHLKVPESKAGTGKNDKIRTFCKSCFEVRIAAEQSLDRQQVERGIRNQARDRETIEAMLWAFGSEEDGRQWVSSRPDTMQTHLSKCPYQTEQVRLQAQAQLKADRHRSDRGRTRAQDYLTATMNEANAFDGSTAFDISAFAPPSLSPSTAFPLPPPITSSVSAPSALGLRIDPPNISVTDHSPSPTVSSADSSTGTPSLSALPFNFLSNFSSSGLGPSVYTRPAKQRRLSPSPTPFPDLNFPSTMLLPQAGMAMFQTTWSDERQRRFESRLARLTASKNLPLSWVDDWEWILFCNEFIPAAKIFSRKTLSNRLISSELAILREGAKRRVLGFDATGQCDGWSGVNHHHYIAFMMTARREIQPINLVDASNERKTAENLLDHMVAVINCMENERGVICAAFTTDASGESKKARKLLQRQRPDIVTPDCYAHQINLIVGDYFKSNAPFLHHSDRAAELISWLRSKTYILALLREIQVANSQKVCSVIRPVLTRWTAHYLAFKRLLELQLALRMMVQKDSEKSASDSDLITGDARSKAKARTMIQTIQDSTFWDSITRMRDHLEPLAIAANMSQATHARLDQVLILFGFLLRCFNTWGSDDQRARDAVVASLEKCWSQADQGVFIMAVILNPAFITKAFARLDFLTDAGIFLLAQQLWQRFFKEEASSALTKDLLDYLHGKGKFQAMMALYEARIRDLAQNPGGHLDPIDAWESICHAGHPPSPLVRLARCILSICPNSASCERLFSLFGNILTKLRSRLGNETLSNLAELNSFVRAEHQRVGTIQRRLKRRFDEPPEIAGYGQTSSAAMPANPHGIINLDVSPLTVQTPLPTPAAVPTPSNDDATRAEEARMDSSTFSFSAIAQTLMDLVASDLEAEQEVLSMDPTSIPPLPGSLQVPLSQLFDLNSSFWSEANASGHLEAAAAAGLEQEQWVYERLSELSAEMNDDQAQDIAEEEL